jgi:hypothetical protein
VSDDDFLRVEASDCPMSSCAAPAGSRCRTGKGKVAVQYHTARFRLVPHLAKALSVPVTALRKPGSAWAELPRPAAAGAGQAGHVRIGYARELRQLREVFRGQLLIRAGPVLPLLRPGRLILFGHAIQPRRPLLRRHRVGRRVRGNRVGGHEPHPFGGKDLELDL